MVDSKNFEEVIRKGKRAGTSSIVIHYLTDEEATMPLVGFIVAKKNIPTAVGRNRVRRQIRHIIGNRISLLPQNSRIVVRILKDAVGKNFQDLENDFESALSRAIAKENRGKE